MKDHSVTLEHYQQVLREARGYSVDNGNIPGSLNDQAWKAWAEKLRPSETDILDHLDTEWRQRFGGDQLAAIESYPLSVTDEAEAELWRLNRADALRAFDYKSWLAERTLGTPENDKYLDSQVNGNRRLADYYDPRPELPLPRKPF